MKKYLILLVVCLLIPLNIQAASGCCSSHGGVDCSKIQSNGKVVCNDGWTGSSCAYSSMSKCSGYNSSSNNSSSNITNNYDSSNNTTVNKITKSSDNKIKELYINSESIVVNDNMTYSTKENKINVEVILSSTVASYTISDTNNLNAGENNISIKVVAENGTSKYYNVNVIREVLSNNTSLKMYANGQQVKFNEYNSELITLDSTEQLDLEYELEDEKAQIELNYDKNIEAGNHTIYFYVIAEDGTKQRYDLNIYKEESSPVDTVIGLGTLCGVGYGIYRLIKKRK